MALNRCVRDILCGLSGAVRGTLASLIEGYIIQLGTYKAALEAQLIYLDILALPVQAANTVAQTALRETKAAVNIIPLNLIGRCADLGDLNEAITSNIDILAADVNNISTDLTRILSQRDEIESIISQLETTINFYNEVLAEMDFCPEGT